MFVWNGLKHVSTACNVFSCYMFVTRLSLQRNLKTKFEMVSIFQSYNFVLLLVEKQYTFDTEIIQCFFLEGCDLEHSE